MKKFQSVLLTPVTIVWCYNKNHYKTPQYQPCGAQKFASCQQQTIIIDPNSLITFDETQNNGLVIEQVLRAAGLVEVGV